MMMNEIRFGNQRSHLIYSGINKYKNINKTEKGQEETESKNTDSQQHLNSFLRKIKQGKGIIKRRNVDQKGKAFY